MKIKTQPDYFHKHYTYIAGILFHPIMIDMQKVENLPPADFQVKIYA